MSVEVERANLGSGTGWQEEFGKRRMPLPVLSRDWREEFVASGARFQWNDSTGGSRSDSPRSWEAERMGGPSADQRGHVHASMGTWVAASRQRMNGQLRIHELEKMSSFTAVREGTTKQQNLQMDNAAMQIVSNEAWEAVFAQLEEDNVSTDPMISSDEMLYRQRARELMSEKMGMARENSRSDVRFDTTKVSFPVFPFLLCRLVRSVRHFSGVNTMYIY